MPFLLAIIIITMGAKRTTVFKKDGQRKATPAKTDALRIFYSSLYKENPKSKMAIDWLIAHGCFGPKKAAMLMLQRGVEKISLQNNKK